MTRRRAVGNYTAAVARLTQSTRRVSALAFAAILWLATVASPLAPGQTFKVLYSFGAYPDGNGPVGGLLMDAAGNLYGTTRYGGSHEGCQPEGQCGTVFKLDTNGVETVLYNFAGPDGANPTSNLIIDANGDLYGTTEFGGDTSCEYGCGVVFKLSGTKETVLYRFTGGEDGAFPWRGVIMDEHGALYGTTNQGGATGGGVAFKLVGKKESVLHSFCSENNCKDGTYLTSGLIMDASGNLYGTAAYGGDVYCDYPSGCGVVFKLTGKKETVLHSFKGPDGDNPVAALFMDPSGNLYGTTINGGKNSNGGTVFKIGQDGKERVLHTFRGVHDGSTPYAAVVRDAQGNLFGTTLFTGGRGFGTVFEITADGKEKILHYFCRGDCSDGGDPSGLIMDAKGNLYGTTYSGGINRDGVIFMITPAPSHSD